jgi:IstB-like ATP binding protein
VSLESPTASRSQLRNPTGSWESRLRKLARPDLLVLDDFGLRDFTLTQADDFYELVSERARKGSFVITSNRAPQDWYALFPNPVVAEGILDRLINSSHHVFMQGRSYRPNKRPGREVAQKHPRSRDPHGHRGPGVSLLRAVSGPFSPHPAKPSRRWLH